MGLPSISLKGVEEVLTTGIGALDRLATSINRAADVGERLLAQQEEKDRE